MACKKKRVCKTIEKRVTKTVEKRVCKTIKKPVCKRPVFKKPVCKTIKKRNSAFRAISGTNQPVPTAEGNPFPQVQYEVEQFDLNNEYNPVTSTFLPRQSGVYALFASVSFASNTVTPIFIGFAITDTETFSSGSGSIDASGIVRLQAGDEVQVFATVSGGSGNIQMGVGSRFEAARIR